MLFLFWGFGGFFWGEGGFFCCIVEFGGGGVALFFVLLACYFRVDFSFSFFLFSFSFFGEGEGGWGVWGGGGGGGERSCLPK